MLSAFSTLPWNVSSKQNGLKAPESKRIFVPTEKLDSFASQDPRERGW